MKPASRITELLGLRSPPVAVRFQDAVPKGIARIGEAAVSGCTYWRLAAEGQTFYTESSDHFGCPVGSHTHGIDLPEDKAKELEELVGTMVELQYIAPEEVSGIPQRQEKFGVAIYAPATDASFEPDAVLVHGDAKQIMLLAEAAHAAGIAPDSSMMGRPTCAAIPAVMASDGAATNLGCIGNRVYTGLADDELYFVAAGSQIGPIGEKLVVIVNANNELDKFHRARVPAQL